MQAAVTKITTNIDIEKIVEDALNYVNGHQGMGRHAEAINLVSCSLSDISSEEREMILDIVYRRLLSEAFGRIATVADIPSVVEVEVAGPSGYRGRIKTRRRKSPRISHRFPADEIICGKDLSAGAAAEERADELLEEG